jgi:hypothetical protein
MKKQYGFFVPQHKTQGMLVQIVALSIMAAFRDGSEVELNSVSICP